VRRRLFDWEPVEAEVSATIMTADGVQTFHDPTRKGVVRPDTGAVLGVFSRSYQIHGYEEWLLRNVADLLDDDLQVGSAGLLGGGARAWVQLETEATQMVAGIELDGSLATTYGVGTQVVVCDNTLSVALRRFRSAVKVRHSAKSLGRLGDVREALGLVLGAGDEFAAQVRELTAEPVSEQRFERFLGAFTDTGNDSKRAATNATNKADSLRALWRTDERVARWQLSTPTPNTPPPSVGTASPVTPSSWSAASTTPWTLEPWTCWPPSSTVSLGVALRATPRFPPPHP
jgi:phage/plasmid-like protein (TIGR03299 family)